MPCNDSNIRQYFLTSAILDRGRYSLHAQQGEDVRYSWKNVILQKSE